MICKMCMYYRLYKKAWESECKTKSDITTGSVNLPGLRGKGFFLAYRMAG